MTDRSDPDLFEADELFDDDYLYFYSERNWASIILFVVPTLVAYVRRIAVEGDVMA